MSLTVKDFQDYGLPYPDLKDSNGSAQADLFMKNIEYLYKKIQQCTRQVSYFDLYKIRDTVSNSNELEAKIAALAPFTSLVVNTNTETQDGHKYSPGDLIVKHVDGTFSAIKAQRGGIFYPKLVQRREVKDSSGENSNYVYDFTFNFKENAPSPSSSVTISGKQVADTTQWDASDKYSANMVFQGLEANSVGSPYNQVITTEDENYKSLFTDAGFLLTSAYTTSTLPLPIPPIIQCYYESNNSSEEVYVDQVVQFDSESASWKIQLLHQLTGSDSTVQIISRVVIK